MSRIEHELKNKKFFIGFLTAGDPSLDKTEEFIYIMEKAGAALIEIGIPFSDPVAEGNIIERANIRALSIGTTIDKIFDMLKRVRAKTDIPLVFLTYSNPVFKYGYEQFFEKCKNYGIDGVIIPDMPFEERKEILPYSKKYDIDVISLIAPTSNDRISNIADKSSGFIYCVSSMGVTGLRNNFNTDIEGMVKRIKTITDIPVAVGFGIYSIEQATNICKFADGVIVGSAIVRIIEEYGENANKALYDYISGICKAIDTKV